MTKIQAFFSSTIQLNLIIHALVLGYNLNKYRVSDLQIYICKYE
jgi:hypothetical protein